MNRIFAAATAACLLALPGAAPAHDHGQDDGRIHVEAPFALISPAGNSGAVFMVIENPGPDDDRLVAASSPVAARVELHTHEEDAAGVMRMIEVEEGFAIPAGGAHRLERGGDHVMLMGLAEPLAEGTVVTVTLSFESAGEVIVEAPVGAPAGGHGAGDHGHHGHTHDSETHGD